MRSIQLHLTVWLALVLMGLSLMSGLSLLLWIRRAMVHEFDRSLLVNARAFESLVTQKANGRLDVDVNLTALSDFTGRGATDYFCFEDLSGTAIAASDPARIPSPRQAASGEAWNSRLPSGRPARAVRIDFQPVKTDEHDDSDEDAGRPIPAVPAGSSLTLRLTVARDRRSLDDLLTGIAIAVIAATLIFTAAAIIAASVVVRRGLGSLRVLAGEVDAVDVKAGDHRFDMTGRPRELLPIVGRLNGLLERVTVALKRERQFTAAVSHELRTPIAELRSAADVAIREPYDLALARRAVMQAQEIAVQMQTMVSTLVSIATAETSAETLTLSSVYLRPILNRSLARRMDSDPCRGLTIDDRVPPDMCVRANEALLGAIIDNVLNNAAQYAMPGSAVLIECVRDEGRLRLSFENQQHSLVDADVEHLFEPFWRKDGARSQSQHVGLGLALVRAYAGAMNATAEATLPAPDRFRISLVLPAVTSALPQTSDGRLLIETVRDG